MKTGRTDDPLNAMQQVFTSFTKGGGAPARAMAEQFWRSQDRVLSSAEEFSRGWFARRHEATRTALEGACNICDAHSPADAVQECQGWMQRSMERVAADVLDYQKHMMTILEAMAPMTPRVASESEGTSAAPSASRPRAA